MKDRYIGRVIKVDLTDADPYALAVSDEVEGTIFFLLSEEVWHEATPPVDHMMVVLEDIYLTKKGWRARSVRKVRPEDFRNYGISQSRTTGVSTC